jgi:hypothetical protein
MSVVNWCWPLIVLQGNEKTVVQYTDKVHLPLVRQIGAPAVITDNQNYWIIFLNDFLSSLCPNSVYIENESFN